MPLYQVIMGPILRNKERYCDGDRVPLSEVEAAPLERLGLVALIQEPQSRIDVNTCTIEQLTDIKGLGESMANAIIALRPIDDISSLSHIPRFRDSWLDLMEVGDGLFNGSGI